MADRTAGFKALDEEVCAVATELFEGCGYAPCFLKPAMLPQVIGELLDLRWEYVDRRLCLASLPLTKNGDSRDVPLSQRALQTLQELRAP